MTISFFFKQNEMKNYKIVWRMAKKTKIDNVKHMLSTALVK